MSSWEDVCPQCKGMHTIGGKRSRNQWGAFRCVNDEERRTNPETTVTRVLSLGCAMANEKKCRIMHRGLPAVMVQP